MKSWTKVACISIALCLALLKMQAQTPAPSSQRQFLDSYCAACHNERLKTGGLSLDRIDISKPDAQPEVWEKVARKLRTGVMPPANMPQPPKAERIAMAAWLETSLD